MCGVIDTWLGQNLAALDVFALDTAEQETGVVASLTLVEDLLEHFNTGNDDLLGVADTDDFNFFVNLDDTLLNTAGSNSATTLDREDVFDRHQEWLVEFALWLWDVVVHSFDQFHDSVFDAQRRLREP